MATAPVTRPRATNGADQPRPRTARLGRQVALLDQAVESVRQEQRPAALYQLQERPPVGPTGRPGLREVLRFGITVEERQRDLGRRQAFPDVPDQQVDDGGAAEGAGQLLTEGGDPPKQGQIVRER